MMRSMGAGGRSGVDSGAKRLAAATFVAVLLAACMPTSSGTPAAPASGQSATPGTGKRLVIDTDMAPDDVVAIASLLRDPAVEVLAITVTGTGEAHCPGGMFVARSIVTMLLETPLPVACGRTSPFDDAQPFPFEWRAGADSGNGLSLVSPEFVPDKRSAGQVLAELAAGEAAAGRKLTILTLGTLTNLASALELDPELPGKVTVVSMLGAVGVPGNVQPEIVGSAPPTAEWNAHADPTAVRLVLEAGFDLTLIPLDATNSVPLTPALYLELDRDHAAGPADLVFELWARNPYMTASGFYLWDPLAAAVVRDPSLVTTRPATLRVMEGAGLDGGRLVEAADGSPVTIATAADREAFERLLLASLRLGGPRSNSFKAVGAVRVTVASKSCEVTFEPSPPPAGLLELAVESTAGERVMVLLFGSEGIPWADLEAFVEAPDLASPPPVAEIASVSLEGPGSVKGWGDGRAGPLGVACAFGDPQTPEILLRGPFPLAG